MSCMLLSGGSDLMGPSGRILLLVGCAWLLSSGCNENIEVKLCILVSECSFCVSVFVPLTSIDLVLYCEGRRGCYPATPTAAANV